MAESGSESLDSYRWLTSVEAEKYLRWAKQWSLDGVAELGLSKRLRKTGLSSEERRLVMQQLSLRDRAKVKFSQADEMFFESQLLQQASSENLAMFKSSRFTDARQIVDYCCGLGGDLIGLARQATSIGVDHNNVCSLLARTNCQVNSLDVDTITSSVEEFSAPRASWFHIDPDRRTGNNRTTRIANFSPTTSTIQKLIDAHGHGAIKIAPASSIPDQWLAAERQWLGDRRECKQQVLWFGNCAKHPGLRTAVAVDQHGRLLFEFVEDSESNSTPSIATGSESFLYEPHATLRAAKLVDCVANKFSLARLDSSDPYLTGDHLLEFGGLSRFKILEYLKLDEQQLSRALTRRDCGRLEIKRRAVDEHVSRRFENFQLTGNLALTLVLTRHESQHVAILAQRIR